MSDLKIIFPSTNKYQFRHLIELLRISEAFASKGRGFYNRQSQNEKLSLKGIAARRYRKDNPPVARQIRAGLLSRPPRLEQNKMNYNTHTNDNKSKPTTATVSLPANPPVVSIALSKAAETVRPSQLVGHLA